MSIIGILVVIFLICAVAAVFNIAFGPVPIPPKLIQIAAIILFVVLVLLLLSWLGVLPALKQNGWSWSG